MNERAEINLDILAREEAAEMQAFHKKLLEGGAPKNIVGLPKEQIIFETHFAGPIFPDEVIEEGYTGFEPVEELKFTLPPVLVLHELVHSR